MNDEDFFSIINLSKSWIDPPFNLNFNASLKKGTTLGIIGRSGSGKSTILKLASGLLDLPKNSETKIILDKKDITSLPPSKREIGMVFQNPALFPHLTVLDNVAYGLRFSKVQKRLSKAEAREKAYEFLKEFEMQDFHSRYPDKLSGGEAQRVSLARTLILRPKVIFFDEPFSALDKPIRKKLSLDIKRLQEKTGFTSLFVTHDIEEAKFICDEITLLKKGQQIWSGKAEDFSEDLLEPALTTTQTE